MYKQSTNGSLAYSCPSETSRQTPERPVFPADQRSTTVRINSLPINKLQTTYKRLTTGSYLVEKQPYPLRIDHSNNSIKFRGPNEYKIFAPVNSLYTIEILTDKTQSDNNEIVRGVASTGYAKSATEENRGKIKPRERAKHKGYGRKFLGPQVMVGGKHNRG